MRDIYLLLILLNITATMSTSCVQKKEVQNIVQNDAPIQIITYSHQGLINDAQVLKSNLDKLNISTEIILTKKNNNHKKLNIFIQDIETSFLEEASQNWVIVNHEFIENPTKYKKINRVLCKTKICMTYLTSFKKLHKLTFELSYLGFTSVVDENKIDLDHLSYDFFYHPAGKSTYKQTNKVLNVWRHNPQFPLLKLTCIKSKDPQSCFTLHLVGDNSFENIQKNYRLLI